MRADHSPSQLRHREPSINQLTNYLPRKKHSIKKTLHSNGIYSDQDVIPGRSLHGSSLGTSSNSNGAYQAVRNPA